MTATKRQDLVVEALDGELLVYDLNTNDAHRLAGEAAQVFAAIDGHRDLSALASAAEVDEPVVADVLLRLEALELLKTQPVGAATRRQALRRLAVGASIAVPTIASIVAPTAAQAGTQGATGQPCAGPADCAGGRPCLNGTCF